MQTYTLGVWMGMMMVLWMTLVAQGSADTLDPTLGVSGCTNDREQTWGQTLRSGERGGLAIFDATGDNIPDIVLGSQIGSSATKKAITLHVYDGPGTGTFTETIIGTAEYVTDILPVDIDSDLDVDLVCVAKFDHKVLLLTNDGFGGFTQSNMVTGLSLPDVGALGDADGDGEVDVVVGNELSKTMGVVWNNNPGFSYEQLPGNLESISSAAIGDADGDGDADILVAGVRSIVFFPGNGSRVFSSKQTLFTSLGTTTIVAVSLADITGKEAGRDIVYVGNSEIGLLSLDGTTHVLADITSVQRGLPGIDVNGDGLDDMVVWGGTSLSVAVRHPMLGLRLVPWTISSSIDSITRGSAGDVDNDGIVDFAAVGDDGGIVFLSSMRGTSGSPLSPGVQVPTTSGSLTDVSFVDWFNRDGNLDLLGAVSSRVVVAEATGTSPGFSPPVTVYQHSENVLDVSCADLDGDGLLDLGVLSYTGVYAILNDGNGAFPVPELIVAKPPGPPTSIMSFMEVTGDLHPELTYVYSNKLYVCPGRGGTSFDSCYPVTGWSGSPDTSLVIDLNNDGWTDVVSSNRVAWNDGVQLQDAVDLGTSMGGDVGLGDLDGDGVPEAVSDSGNTIVVHSSSVPWSGLYDVSNTVHNPGATIHEIVIADVNGDGANDIVFATPSDIGVLTNDDGSGSSWSPTLTPAPGSISSSTLLTVLDFERDGDDDVVVMFSSSVFTMVGSRSAIESFAPRTISSDSPLIRTGMACSSNPDSMICLYELMGKTSLCRQDTLLLPADSTFSQCPVDVGLTVTHAVDVVAPAGAPASINCTSGGVAFTVVANPEAPTALMGRLSLERVNVVGTTSGTGSVMAGSGLVCRGKGTMLSISSAKLSDSSAMLSPVALVDAGHGGAVLVADGCGLDLHDVVLENNHAAVSGGAIMATGADTSVSLVSVQVVGCSAGENGGGIAILTQAAFSATNVTLAECESGSAGGGAYVDGSSIVLRDVVFSNNTAGTLGGALTLRPPFETGSNITVSNLMITSNSATKAGGGISFTPATIDAGVLLAENVAQVAQVDVGTTPSSSQDGRLVVLDGSITLRGNSAGSFGGGLWVCGSWIDTQSSGWMTAEDNIVEDGTVSVASDVFVCGGSGVSGPRVGPDLPWIRAVSTDMLAQSAISGPVSRVVWDERAALPASTPAGSSVGGSVVVEDVFGAGTPFGGVSVTVTFSSDANAVPPSDPLVLTTGPNKDGVVTLSPFTVYGAPGSDPGGVVTATAKVVVGHGRSPLPSATNDVVVEGCGLESGAVDVMVGSSPALACQACIFGTISEVDGAYDACQPIPECPANTVRLAASNESVVGESTNSAGTTGVCECVAGTFSPTGETNVACISCPQGATCAGGVTQPIPQEGYYEIKGGDFVLCVRPDACYPWGCAEGYSGYMCNKCEGGRYTNPEGECVECPSTAFGVIIGALVGIALLASVVGVVVGWRVAREMRPSKVGQAGGGNNNPPPSSTLRHRLLPPSVAMVLVSWQTVAILGGGELSWDSTSKAVLNMFNAANIDLRMTAPDCALGSFHKSYVMSVSLPALLLLLVMAVLIVMRGCTQLGSVSVLHLVEAVVFSVAPLLYIPMSRSTLVLFDCTQLPSGDWVLDIDPSVACFDSAWKDVVPVGVVGVVFYVIGLPGFIVWVLMLNRPTLFDLQTFARYGVLYRLWQAQYFWGEVVGLIKRLALVSIGLFASSVPLLQINLTLLVLGGHVAWFLARRPYYFSLYNRVEIGLGVLLSIILLVGAGTHSERNSGASKAIYGMTTVVVIGILILFSTWAIFADIAQIRSERRGSYSESETRASYLAKHLGAEIADLDAADAAVVAAALAPHPADLDEHEDPPWDSGSDSDQGIGVTMVSSIPSLMPFDSSLSRLEDGAEEMV